MNQPYALHFDCVMCLNDCSNPPSNEVFRAMMLMLLSEDIPPEQIRNDLCFAHRRIVEDDIKQAGKK